MFILNNVGVGSKNWTWPEKAGLILHIHMDGWLNFAVPADRFMPSSASQQSLGHGLSFASRRPTTYGGDGFGQLMLFWGGTYMANILLTHIQLQAIEDHGEGERDGYG